MDLGSRNKIKIEAGMSSMTDLVFLLLIFFIIMSIMSNEYTPVDLPNPDVAPPKVTDSVTPTVVITEDNQYVVLPGGSMDTPMTFEDIMGLADAAVTSSNKMKLKIAGHRLADYEAVFRVLALCQANGWDPVLAYDQSRHSGNRDSADFFNDFLFFFVHIYACRFTKYRILSGGSYCCDGNCCCNRRRSLRCITKWHD